ncbi:phenoloxidase-activating factor 2 [Teleopsis dalmanni]|uniref:phenoloxidase-activating factor 2 n=1 Tax=Teleopsis dalmanni TaxID=139649 RepID=UPI0018CD8869|nr:phenoloxidase-activating factor 2 [Teleopsis dalmanni]
MYLNTKIYFFYFIVFLSNCFEIHSLAKLDYTRERHFTFSSNTGPTNGTGGNLPPQQSQVLARQLITGTVTPNIVTPTSYCICVPAGSCPNPITNPTDGSGQIDIRIVNNPAVSPVPVPFTCSYGLTICCQAGTYQCGRRYPPPPGSATAGAGQADFGEYPWQVALLTTGEVYLGSGALITAQHVLTAAHKVYNVSPASFKVRVGEWDAASTSEPIPAQDVTIASVFIHPSFNSANLQNDVAILRLSTPVSLMTKSTVGTICLPTTSFVGQRCYVAGWGKNDFGPNGAYQAIQREVDVPLIPNANCQTALQNTRLGATFILNNGSFICAGGEAGKDACTGDGGSPLVCQNSGIWYVVGLVAWGIGCATAGIPGVYVNVANFLPWIQTTLAS